MKQENRCGLAKYSSSARAPCQEMSSSLSLSSHPSARCSKLGTKKSCYLQPADSGTEKRKSTSFEPLDSMLPQIWQVASPPNSERTLTHTPENFSQSTCRIPSLTSRMGGSRQALKTQELCLITEDKTRRQTEKSCTVQDEE